MGIPAKLNDIMRKHLRAYAAWPPIVNTYRLGDYGIIADGVFSKLGNVKDDFGITFEPGEGPDASLDFVSADTTVVNLVGNAVVDVIPEGAIGVRTNYKFNSANSFLIKAATIRIKTIENLNKVAQQLQARGDWEKKWKVVWQTYHAESAAVLSTISAGTEVDFSGDAKALKKFNLGDVSAGVNIQSKKELGLKVLGKSGVIGLGLFKLHWLTEGPDILKIEEGQVEAKALDVDAAVEDDV